ncbi:MAG: 50S ribosomal protein L25 [Candidatus Andersenbacteria bacterium]
MAETLSLTASVRDSHLGELRRAGNIPGVLYGHGIDPISVSVEYRVFEKAYKQAGYTTIINLDLGDKQEHSVFITAIQFHPTRSTIMHVDFHQVRMDEVVTAHVPIEFIGESSAVKNLGGTLLKNVDELEVEALPKDLPHELKIDISALTDFETVLHVSDIMLPTGVTTLQDADVVVASVQPPRTEAEMDSLSEEVKEDVEAVEGVKKPEPVEGEEGAEGAEKKDDKKE